MGTDALTVSTSIEDLAAILLPSQIATFWSRVDRDSDPYGCHRYRPEAPGRRGKYRHVRIRMSGVDVFAHRLAYVLSGGIIDNAVIIHSCDVGECCAYNHLSCSTIAENNRQRDERNRRTPLLPRGAASWSAKLTDRDVQAILRARSQQVPAKVLATMFDVSPASIYNVWTGRHYGTSRAGECP